MFVRIQKAVPSILVQFIFLAATIGIALALYWPAIHNGYVWDDLTLFIQSPTLRTGGITWTVVSQPVIQGTTYFRPFVLLSFATEFRLFGVDPAVSHGINLAIYVFNVGLVFLLGRALFSRMSLTRPYSRAFLAAILYAVHPSLVESTVWVSGRFDQLVTTFALCTLLAETLVRQKLLRPLILSAFFFLALISKEAAICVPVLLLLQRLLYDRIAGESLWAGMWRILRSDWRTVAMLATVFAVYLFLRVSAMERVLHAPNLEATSNSARHLSFVLNTVAFYVREILVPFVSVSPLHPYNPSELTSFGGNLRAFAAGLVLLLIAVLALRNVRPGLQALAVLVALLPVLNLVPLTLADSIGNDRFLTLPLALCALFAATLRFRDYAWLRRHAQVLAVMLVAGSWTTLSVLSVRSTTPLWRDGISLWTWAYRKHPTSDMARTTFLVAAQGERRFDLMGPVLEEMMAKGRLTQRQQLIYGGYLVETGDAEEGKNYILGVLKTTTPFHTLGKEELRRRKSQELLFGALSYGYHALAVAQIKESDLAGALESTRISLWYRPNTPVVLLQQSNILLAMGRMSESEAAFRQGLALSLPAEQPQVLAARDALQKSIAPVDANTVPPLPLPDAGR